ncbi:MAG: SLC13/DASS family transporter [Bacteroidetes bacterium]|nr:SLC13/DASS family transporter [Bacteroidota bacterium]
MNTAEHIDKPDRNSIRFWLFVAAPVLAVLIILFGDLNPGNPQTTYMFAITVLIALWWVTEIIPLGITSLLPVVLFPVFGIMDGEAVSAVYFNDVIFLFMGGFLMALAIQKWNLHKRIALWILKKVGVSPARILLGFMLATTFISMWISNTATTMMMVPILISILAKLEEINGSEKISHYSVGILLAVAYSATVGGITTLVGTPPNLSFARIFKVYFPEAPPITFGDWFIFAFPVTVVLFLVFFAYLYFFYVRNKTNWNAISRAEIERDYQKLGKPSHEEKIIMVLFVFMAMLWFFRVDICIGNFVIPGWSRIFHYSGLFNDGTVAVFIGVLLFIIPAKAAKKRRLMTWKDAELLPWEIILLFGGGFALANGMRESGLAMWCGSQLTFLGELHPMLIILLITLFITFLGEISSNTAMVETFLPVLAGLAVTLQVNPLLFMIPATLGASMGFMLPIATPPNAIVFATKRIKMGQMMRTGFALNLISVVIITLFMYYFGTLVFGIEMDVFPDWAD